MPLRYAMLLAPPACCLILPRRRHGHYMLYGVYTTSWRRLRHNAVDAAILLLTLAYAAMLPALPLTRRLSPLPERDVTYASFATP